MVLTIYPGPYASTIFDEIVRLLGGRNIDDFSRSYRLNVAGQGVDVVLMSLEETPGFPLIQDPGDFRIAIEIIREVMVAPVEDCLVIINPLGAADYGKESDGTLIEIAKQGA